MCEIPPTSWNNLNSFVVWSIVVTETSERCAYYGFRAILVLWFTIGLGYNENEAVAMFAMTTALAYGSPLLGAILADGGLGRYRTIFWFSLLYLVGLAFLTAAGYSSYSMNTPEAAYTEKPALARRLTFVGLLFACIGTGGIKPCVSAFGADQISLQNEDVSIQGRNYSVVATNPSTGTPFQEMKMERDTASSINQSLAVDTDDEYPERSKRIQEFFAIFYVGINIGALLAFVAIPMVRASWGFGAAFLFPTLFMALALGVFWSQRRKYKHGTSASSLMQMMRVCALLMYERLRRVCKRYCFHHHGNPLDNDQHPRLSDDASYSPQNPCNPHAAQSGSRFESSASTSRQPQPEDQIIRDASQCLHILPILSLLPIFWMLYDQQSSVWTLQAIRMDLKGLQPEQLNVLNTIEIIAFVPLFDRVVYPFLKKHGVWNALPLSRMKWGMFFASLAFVTSGMLEMYIQLQSEPNIVHIAWQIPQITLLSIGEVLLSVTGLEFAYAQAPPTAQAFILAVYCFMTTMGDALGALLYSGVFATMNVASAMMICALLMLFNMAIFSQVALVWKPFRSQGQDGPNHLAEDANLPPQEHDLHYSDSFVEMSRTSSIPHID